MTQDEDSKNGAEPTDTDSNAGVDAGEDEGSTAKEGKEDHLKDDQKTPSD